MSDSDGQSNSAAVGSDPATSRVDVQDPLPENNWFWRRTYVFIMSILSLAFIWYGVEALYALNRGEEIYQVTRYMIGICAMLILFYMVAPSAEQIVKLIQAARILREGGTITRKAVAETPEGGRTEVTTTAGTPAASPALPAAPAASAGDEDDVAPRSRT